MRKAVKDRLGAAQDGGKKLSVKDRLGPPAEAVQFEPSVGPGMPVIPLGGDAGLALEIDAALWIEVVAPPGAILTRISTWDLATALEKVGRGAVPRLELKLVSTDDEGGMMLRATPESPIKPEKIVAKLDGERFKVPGNAVMLRVNVRSGASAAGTAGAGSGGTAPWDAHFTRKFEASAPGERADTIVVAPIPSRCTATSDIILGHLSHISHSHHPARAT